MRYVLAVLVLVGACHIAAAQGTTRPTAPSGKAPASATVPQIPADPHATSAAYGDWIVACQRTVSSGQRICEVLQAVQVQGQPAPIARLAIAKATPPANLRLVLVLPSNITIGADPMITVGETDKEGTKATWQRCLPGGCIAEASLTDKIAAQWRSEAGQALVTFKDGLGRDLTVPFSFRGLAQALDALAKE